MSVPWSNKKDCRFYFQERLRSISDSERLIKQELFNQQAKSFLRCQKGFWAGFRAIQREISVDFVGQDDLGLSWVFPRVTESGLDFLGPVGSFGPQEIGDFEKGTWGILEPKRSGSIVDRFILNGFIVPGLGFNESGVRIGRGKAYYDRALALTKGLKVGVCFSDQLVRDQIPSDTHDIRMDYIISDLGIIKCK